MVHAAPAAAAPQYVGSAINRAITVTVTSESRVILNNIVQYDYRSH